MRREQGQQRAGIELVPDADEGGEEERADDLERGHPQVVHPHGVAVPQRVPHREAGVEHPWLVHPRGQLLRRRGLFHRRHAFQEEGIERLHVGVGHIGVGRIRHGREQAVAYVIDGIEVMANLRGCDAVTVDLDIAFADGTPTSGWSLPIFERSSFLAIGASQCRKLFPARRRGFAPVLQDAPMRR